MDHRQQQAMKGKIKDIHAMSEVERVDETSGESPSQQHSTVEQRKPTAELSPPGSRILEQNVDHHPFFYYENSTQPHHFLLHSHPGNQHDNSLYGNYGTTLTIIILLHLFYFYQWNTRRSRQEVCTSYDQLVDKKQFYRAAVAIASHPPVDGGERDTLPNIHSHHGTAEGGEPNANNSGPVSRFRLCDRITPIFHRIRPFYNIVHQRVLRPLIYGSLSGLPLLAFASHILWQCRALEEFYDEHNGKLILGVTGNANITQFSGIGTAATKIQTAGDLQNIHKPMSLSTDEFSYFRVLVALAFTSILLELSLMRSMLRRIDAVVDFDGYRTTPRQLLSQRAMCSIASLSTALLGVYDSHFPYAPPPVLPFVRVSFLSSSGFSLIFSIMILTILTHRIHPITSIMSGLLSGSLWSLGLTSFLGTKYWGNALLFCLALGMLFSLKAQPSYSIYMEKLIPCLDYVAWDSDGEIPDGGAAGSVYRRTNSRGGTASQTNINGEDLEMGLHLHQTQNGSHREERFPLLSSQTSSMSNGSSSAIRGRVPLMNTMDSDLESSGDMVTNNEETMPTASSRFGASLSRRAGGAGAQ